MDLSFHFPLSFGDLKNPTSREKFANTLQQKRIIDLRPCLLSADFQICEKGYFVTITSLQYQRL